MALVLKANETITDPADSKIDMTTCYAVVDYCISDKGLRQQQVKVNFYRRACTCEERCAQAIKPYFKDEWTITGDDFDTWFSETAMAGADKTVYSQAYLYLLQLQVPIPTDPQEEQQYVYEFAQWESDER